MLYGQTGTSTVSSYTNSLLDQEPIVEQNFGTYGWAIRLLNNTAMPGLGAELQIQAVTLYPCTSLAPHYHAACTEMQYIEEGEAGRSGSGRGARRRRRRPQRWCRGPRSAPTRPACRHPPRRQLHIWHPGSCGRHVHQGGRATPAQPVTCVRCRLRPAPTALAAALSAMFL